MSSPAGTQRKIYEAVLLSAKQESQKGNKGIKKRYFPWQFGVDYDVIGKGSSQDLFTEQLAVRDMLRSSGEWGSGLGDCEHRDVYEFFVRECVWCRRTY